MRDFSKSEDREDYKHKLECGLLWYYCLIWDDQNNLLAKRLRAVRIDIGFDGLFSEPVENTGAGWHLE